MQSACAVLYCHLCPVRLYRIFPHYIKNGTILGKMLPNLKCVFRFSLQLLYEIFLTLRIIQRDIVINVLRPSCKLHAVFFHILMKLEFCEQIFENPQIWNLIKIHPVGAALFYADRRTDRRIDTTQLIVAFAILQTHLKILRSTYRANLCVLYSS
jgi:hypothetical protein